MAPVTRWALAAGLACAALAVVYLPPRGSRARTSEIFMAQYPRGTAARARAQRLAEEWRAAEGALQLYVQRRALQTAVAAQSPLVTFSEPARVKRDAAVAADSAFRRAWRQLRLGETKVRVALVVELDRVATANDRPLSESGIAAYLAPDSTDRTTCLVFLPVGRYWTLRFTDPAMRVPVDQLTDLLRSGLGPCGFYAAFGTPGKPVHRWLIARRWDVGLTLDAARDHEPTILATARHTRWYWQTVYGFPPSSVACMAGRAQGCRAALLRGASDDGMIPVPNVVRADRRWWRQEQFVAAQRFLADVQEEIGRERFRAFWTSPLPVDTALSAALKQPVGEWVAGWQRRYIEPVRLGAAAPLGSSVLGLVLGGIALAVVAAAATRRQVR